MSRAHEPPAVIGELLDYAGSDLLCYRAEHPEALVARQAEVWQPLLEWAARDLDAPLRVACSSSPRDSTEPTPDNAEFALALLRGCVGADAAFAAAELDGSFQIELWGEDPEATRRRAAVHAELAAAGRLFELLSD